LYVIIFSTGIVFLARYAVRAMCCRPSVCLSIRPFVRRTGESVKKVKVRIMHLSPLSSPMTVVSSRKPQNSKKNIGSEGAE